MVFLESWNWGDALESVKGLFFVLEVGSAGDNDIGSKAGIRVCCYWISEVCKWGRQIGRMLGLVGDAGQDGRLDFVSCMCGIEGDKV